MDNPFTPRGQSRDPILEHERPMEVADDLLKVIHSTTRLRFK
ncbi:hypothetical protein [Tunturiibacter gelidoferens]|uniref:Uncharacterized protein n=1 Tax=Tunturiibacter lichenicola TaxID=2051959 RepID=A0A7Y9T2G0_9BACT|nr:hypothetical protein [Edaphobacter lichenicola]NYF51628.1 hypothetical protein [Edaphobacter lichenicola]